MEAVFRALVALTCLSGGAALLLAALFGAWPRRRTPREKLAPRALPVDAAIPTALPTSLGCLHGAGDYRSYSSLS